MHTSQRYPSDLNDAEWSIIARQIPEAKPGGRPPKYSRRMILNAIFYLNRSGCQWRMLPSDFPPRSTVFGYFAAWRRSGLWERINARLREQVRKREGRKPSPTAAILDSQSVKGAEQGGDEIGYDAGKKVSGRKRHIVVDTLGMILGLCVTSAAVQDRDGAVTLLSSVYLLFHRLKVIWADGGYSGALVDWVKSLRPSGNLRMEIVKRSDDAKGFQLVRKRWIVERTFSWLYKCRRLARDYECRTDHSESQIYVSMCRLMLKRLAKS
jgi:putative transposase